MDKKIQYREKDLKDIELDLEELSIQLIDILKYYKIKGVINNEEYEQHIKVKEKFLTYLQNKREKDL
ncbi:hypothetical protein [Natronincola ferrireducens]|uniref:Uncharacterized protein n=1 Tax=Natronincola ferrireducens TaxID=393762 RepID=A0A1G9A0L1_9FIRM|nr:hypothetical protein [Natronincola ferrireducens]SDK20886.1 hypothetical protein SAMN05660472_01026 [Natronincola ferrireducens]